MTNRLPKNWATPVCSEVIAYLEKKNNCKLLGNCEFYGEVDGAGFAGRDSFKYGQKYLSNKEFLELSKEEEEFKRGELVEYKTCDGSWSKKIYVTTIEGAKNPYVLVNSYDENEFLNGKPFLTSNQSTIRKIKTQKEIDIENAISLLTKEGKLVDGKVLS